MLRERPILAAGMVAAATLAALALAMGLPNLGLAPVWLWLLLAVPLTVGLPTTLGVLLVVSLWHGPPLWACALCAAALGFGLQCTVHRLVARRFRRAEARA
jgi:hypothetical protein